MRAWETIIGELEAEGKIRHPHQLLRQKDRQPETHMLWLLRTMAQQGQVNGIYGRSGVGKTWLASSLLHLYAKMGFGVIHNLPIVAEHPLIVRETLLSQLTERLCNEPLDNTSRPLVVFVDEAALHASGSLGGMSKKLTTFKMWVTSFMRKLGGGKGAALFIVFQHNSQAAPLFRGDYGQQNGLIFGEITKISHTEAIIDFPNDKGKYGFEIPKDALPFFLDNILPPRLKTYSFGPSSFEVDFDVMAMEAYVARHTREIPTPQNFRKAVIEYLTSARAKGEGARNQSGAKGRTADIKSVKANTVYEKMLLLSKVYGIDHIAKMPVNQFARDIGVSPASVTQARKKLGIAKV